MQISYRCNNLITVCAILAGERFTFGLRNWLCDEGLGQNTY